MGFDTSFEQILYESEINDLAIFEAVIKSDLYELEMGNSSAIQEAELIAFTEASIKGFYDKVIGFLQNIIEKLNEVLGTFDKKLMMFLLIDNKDKALYYNGLLKGKDLSKFDYISKRSSGLNFTVPEILRKYNGMIPNFLLNVSDNTDPDHAIKDIKEALFDLTLEDELLMQLLRSSINGVGPEIKSVQDYRDFCQRNTWGPGIGKKVGLNDTEKTVFLNILARHTSKDYKEINESKKAVIKEMKSTLNTIKKESESKLDPRVAKEKANAEYTIFNIFKTAFIESFNANMKYIKERVAYADAVLRKAVLYKPGESNKSTNESFLLEYSYDVFVEEFDLLFD